MRDISHRGGGGKNGRRCYGLTTRSRGRPVSFILSFHPLKIPSLARLANLSLSDFEMSSWTNGGEGKMEVCFEIIRVRISLTSWNIVVIINIVRGTKK